MKVVYYGEEAPKSLRSLVVTILLAWGFIMTTIIALSEALV